jgi:hypothetical protein
LKKPSSRKSLHDLKRIPNCAEGCICAGSRRIRPSSVHHSTLTWVSGLIEELPEKPETPLSLVKPQVGPELVQ